jgi:hypothetical protein
MRPFNFKQKPPLTPAEFSAALREAGFGVERAHRRCKRPVPRLSAFRGRSVIDRPKTLAKAIRERDAEVKRRAPRAET